jgi:2-methylcitrate dehydratase PrpD
MPEITRQLAEYAAKISLADLPPLVIERAKALLADLVGIAIRARFDAESTPALLAGAKHLGLLPGDATIIGDARGASPAGAALINGTLAHSLDFDDTHAAGSIHPSAPIVPAALAAAEMVRAGGADTLAAIVAGYEMQIRLSLALSPKDHYLRGFHPTATCGAFGAAAAAGRVFGLSPARMADAFGIVLSGAAGSMQFTVNGAWTKRSQVGGAAMSGLIAAALAREGYVGASEAIEGQSGFLRSYAPNPDFAKAAAGLGSTYETLNIAVKPYPSCRYSHAPIDALVALQSAHGIRADEVEAVEIGVSRTGWSIIGDPNDAKQSPKNVVDCQFSMPFLAAVALRQGGLAWDDYARHLRDPATLALTKRVRCVPDAQAEAEFPRRMSGVARIKTKRGAFEKFVADPAGEPETFPTGAQQRAKFDGLAAPYMAAGERGALFDALATFDRANSVADVLALTKPSRHAAAAE